MSHSLPLRDHNDVQIRIYYLRGSYLGNFSNRTGLWWGISGGQAKQLQFNFKHLVICPILSTL